MKTKTILFTAALAVLFCASSRAADFSFKEKYPPFAGKLDAALSDAKLSDAEKNTAIEHVNAWLADNTYAEIGKFLDALRPDDVAEIVKTAARSNLVSDDGVPVAEDPSAYGQRTLLTLPFDGVWHVVQGNSGIVSHKKGGVEEYAWDFVIVHNGQQANGSAQVNETHYCWAHPVLAPAPGVVAEVVDDLEDHPPYTINPPPHGNHVYIDHENGEISLLYHLKKGSALVKPGDRVKRGQPVGLCGDTGISMFPHLHFVLYKGTVKKHQKMETHFFGYFSLRSDNPATDAKMKLRLAGIPRRLDYVMNGAEMAKVSSK